MTLGEKLKTYRTSKGLSQEKVSELLNVSRQAVTKWESGQTTPSSDNIIALAKLYDVSLDELVGMDAQVEKITQNSPKANLILRANLIKIAIILQAASLNIAIQPLYTNSTPYHFAFLLFKYLPLLATSVWMAFNLRYEKDEKQSKKNARIEFLYCVIMLATALIGYYTKWYFPVSLMLITVCSIYILVINPRYMNRQLVKKKGNI